MKHFTFSIGLASIGAFMSSCNKPNLLLAEKAQVENEIKQCQADVQAIDAKILSLGVDAPTALIVLGRQSTEWKRTNALLEQELARMNSKCTEGEASLKRLGPLLDAFKAKSTR